MTLLNTTWNLENPIDTDLKHLKTGNRPPNRWTLEQFLHSQAYFVAICGPPGVWRDTCVGLWLATSVFEQRRQVVVGGARRWRRLVPSLNERASKIGNLSPLKFSFVSIFPTIWSIPSSLLTTWRRSESWLFSREGTFLRKNRYSARTSDGVALDNIFLNNSSAVAATNSKSTFSSGTTISSCFFLFTSSICSRYWFPLRFGGMLKPTDNWRQTKLWSILICL